MHKNAWFLVFAFLIVQNSIAAFSPPYEKTEKGVVLYTDPAYTGSSKLVELQVITPRIIRVLSAPGRVETPSESLITVYPAAATAPFDLSEQGSELVLKTSALTVTVQRTTGQVRFFDNSGQLLLTEKHSSSAQFKSVIHEGKALLQVTQEFEGAADEAWYGLGQHQDGVYNYRNRQVYFFQNNTEVAIPFLLSSRQYGLLWHNYSLTTAGDLRAFHPLSALALTSKSGELGWLTASYYNADGTAPVVERAESAIAMEFLGDSKQVFPDVFHPAKGKVIWEGKIASGFTGLHQLRLTYGGTIRLWINGELIADRWRKAWNPAPALLDINLSKNEPASFKLEWLPEGTESYLSFKWQEPAPDGAPNIGFSSEAGQQIDYYFVHGANADDIIGGYRYLTGKAPIVPKWALGFWQSRERYKTQTELLDVVKEFRKRKIPLDNIVLDWSYWKEDDWGSQDFDPKRFSSPDSLINVLHKDYHTRFMISVWPKFYEGIPAYDQFNKNGWLYRRNIADRQRDWIGKGYMSTFYDAFNEDARKGFWNLIHDKIYTKGIDAWWMDASEPDILSNVSPEKRKLQMSGTAMGPAAEWLNAYPLLNAKGIYEGQRGVDSNKRVYLLTRSGFAGSQRYGATIWSGDIGATWLDMKHQISAGINFSMSGLPYWTMDIGGFVVPSKFEQPTKADTEEWRELLTRWYQFGAFVPIFRAHGQYPYREIFNIAPEEHPAYSSMLYYTRLRYRLLPYIYSLAGAAYHDDYTMMRGLVMDFPTDSSARVVGDQFLFGSSLLVNPVYEYGKTQRPVYLPAGQGWYDLYTGKFYSGGQVLELPAPYNRMPTLVKEGSILPIGQDMEYTSQKKADTITLFVYRGRDAEFNLYEDDGLNYDYERGKFSNIRISYQEKTGEVIIGNRDGSFPGMLTKRVFTIVSVQPGDAKGLDTNQAPGKRVRYLGKQVKIQL